MTMIRFTYSDSYHNPTRGSLAFMPHRRHAANETEILPKPFTVSLSNGTVEVNLKPNSQDWVWMVTEHIQDHIATWFATIPDQDGVIPHTELIKINPSTLPAPYDAVEPAWWAEIRSQSQMITGTLLNVEQALDKAQHALDTGEEAVNTTQHNASRAKAYADQSRQFSYDADDHRTAAKTWRDEAEYHADRAATGPESAAARSEAAATISETARDTATQAATTATTARDETLTARDTATQAATTATNEADRATTQADRAQGYADDMLQGPQDILDETIAARDTTENYRDQAQQAANAADTSRQQAQNAATQATTARDEADLLHGETQQLYDNTQTLIDGFQTVSQWYTVPLEGGETHHSDPVRARIIGKTMHIVGALAANPERTTGKIGELPAGAVAAYQQRLDTSTNYEDPNNQLRFNGQDINIMKVGNTRVAWIQATIQLA